MRRRHLGRILATSCAVFLLASCATIVSGKPVSVFEDPFRVAGLEAVGGPNGLRPDAEESTHQVENSDGGMVDEIAGMSVSDIEAFWETSYRDAFGGRFDPVDELISWDSDDHRGSFCREDTYRLVNAGFCKRNNTIGWDRGVLLPQLRRGYGDMAITMVLAHEYGHAIQRRAKLNKRRTPTLVIEQQADCLAAAYVRWVVEGNSTRFTLNTGEGLNNILAGMIAFRDPLPRQDDTYDDDDDDEHGSAFERISAFQFGFTDGASSCAAIDAKDITQRRGDLPVELQLDQTGEWPVSEESVHAILDAMSILFEPADPPLLSFDADEAASCADARPSPPASYCPDTNTIVVDLAELQEMGAVSGKGDTVMLSGDNTAYSVLMSRFMLAIQQEHGGLILDNAAAGLRTACLTGVGTTMLSKEVTTPDGNNVALTAGDLDEAVSGLLTNGLAASDVNGETVPAGFSRIDAFRTGVLGDTDRCIKRFR